MESRNAILIFAWGVIIEFIKYILSNVMMSYADAWRGDCATVSVTSNRIGSIYWLGSFLGSVALMF
jgi:hypothetical protein